VVMRWLVVVMMELSLLGLTWDGQGGPLVQQGL